MLHTKGGGFSSNNINFYIGTIEFVLNTPFLIFLILINGGYLNRQSKNRRYVAGEF